MDAKDYLKHFPDKFTKEMNEYVTNEVFRESRYMFIWRVGKDKVGYCTHCGKTSPVSSGFKHNDTDYCPNCRSHVTFKANGIKRGKLLDYAYFVFYEKSALDPNVVVAYGIEAVRDYRSSYYDVETKYSIEAKYYFEMGNSTMFLNDYYGQLNQHKTVFSLFSRKYSNSMWAQRKSRMYIGYSRESLRRAIAGTAFQYSCYESYFRSDEEDDMVKFMSLYSKYPCIEYLMKMGMQDVVTAKLTGHQTYSAIHWRGKTLPKVLRLPKNIIKNIQKEELNVTPILLRIMQLLAKEDEKIPYAALESIDYGGYYFEELLRLSKYSSLSKSLLYIHKQFNKYKKQYPSPSSVISTWRDYIGDCGKLKRDLKNEQMLFPANLHEEHQKTIELIKQKEDKSLNKKIKNRITKELDQYRFELGGLLIRPAENSMELINEGNALKHCVGGYAKKYADGKTNIFFIRKVTEPDKPYFTVEFFKDQVRQVRGLKNCIPNELVDAFMEAFTSQKLKTKKIRVRVPA